MRKPNIIALPTSQMLAFCDLLGLSSEVQGSKESMIVALEEADFTKLKSGIIVPDKVSADIVATRKVRLGRV